MFSPTCVHIACKNYMYKFTNFLSTFNNIRYLFRLFFIAFRFISFRQLKEMPLVSNNSFNRSISSLSSNSRSRACSYL